MKSIKEVKNEYARTLNNGHGGKFKDWDQFSRSAYINNEDIEKIAMLYAQSQTQELQQQNAELVETLQRFIDNNMMIVTADDEAKVILTKYNHLNKKP